jgi:hypothetical protein
MTRRMSDAAKRPLEASLSDLDHVVPLGQVRPLGRAGATHRGWMGAGDHRASVQDCRSRGKV